MTDKELFKKLVDMEDTKIAIFSMTPEPLGPNDETVYERAMHLKSLVDLAFGERISVNFEGNIIGHVTYRKKVFFGPKLSVPLYDSLKIVMKGNAKDMRAAFVLTKLQDRLYSHIKQGIIEELS